MLSLHTLLFKAGEVPGQPAAQFFTREGSDTTRVLVAFIRLTKKHTSAQFTSRIIASQLTSKFIIPSEPHPIFIVSTARYPAGGRI
jgi:hypothetical protein